MVSFQFTSLALLAIAIVLVSPVIMAAAGVNPTVDQPQDFSMTTPWTTARVLQGSVNSDNWLNLTSLGGFNGTVYLSSSTPFPTYTVFLGLYQTSVSLSAGATSLAQFYISIGMSAPPGSYIVWITGGSGSITHYVQLTIIVEQRPPPPPDFTIGANPSSLSIKASSTAASAISLYSLNGYSGNISLTATPSFSGLTVTFDFDPVSLSGSQPATSTLTLQGTSPGYFSVNVTATDALNTHSIGLSVQVYTNQIMPGPTSLMYSLGYRGLPYPGGSTNLVNNFTNLGITQMRVTSITINTDFGSFTPTGTPLTLDPGQERTLLLRINIPQSVTIGNHTITASVNWQYSNSSAWVDQAPLSVTGNLGVAQNPSPLNSFITQMATGLLTDTRMLAVVFGYLAVVSVATLVFARHEQRHRSRPSLGPK